MRWATPTGVTLSFSFPVPFYSLCTLSISAVDFRGELVRTVVFITRENDVRGIGDRPEKPPRSTTTSWMDERPTAREIAVWTLPWILAGTFVRIKHFPEPHSICIVAESFTRALRILSHPHRFFSSELFDRWSRWLECARAWTRSPDNAISPISIFIAVQRHSLAMWPRNSSGFDRTPSRFPFQIAQMVPPDFRRITRRRSAAVDTVYNLVRNWQYVLPIRLSTFGGYFQQVPELPALELESRFSDIFADRSFRGSHVCGRQIWYYGNLISSNSASLRYRSRSDRRPRSDCSRISASSPAINWNSLLFSELALDNGLFFKTKKVLLKEKESCLSKIFTGLKDKKVKLQNHKNWTAVTFI